MAQKLPAVRNMFFQPVRRVFQIRKDDFFPVVGLLILFFLIYKSIYYTDPILVLSGMIFA